ncbi:MAG: hypothetical protein WA624_20550 [Methylocella sp.]
MSELDEIKAMQKLAEALEPLDEPARQRALQWAISRYRAARASSLTDLPNHANAESSGESSGQSAFATFADLFEATSPKTESEKALVAGYWAQVCENQTSFAAQILNSMLKDLGHGVGNITEALTALKSDKPASVLQLKKSGTSRQARKTYKLSQEGIRRVQAMLRARTDSQ